MPYKYSNVKRSHSPQFFFIIFILPIYFSLCGYGLQKIQSITTDTDFPKWYPRFEQGHCNNLSCRNCCNRRLAQRQADVTLCTAPLGICEPFNILKEIKPEPKHAFMNLLCTDIHFVHVSNIVLKLTVISLIL